MATEHERAGLVLVRREELVRLRAFVERVGRHVAPGICNECRREDCDEAYISTCHGWGARRLLRENAALAAGVSSADE